MRRTLYLILLALLASGIGSASTMYTQEISYIFYIHSQTLDATNGNFNPVTGQVTLDVDLPKFDTTLLNGVGKLTNIEFVLNTSISATVTVLNSVQQPGLVFPSETFTDIVSTTPVTVLGPLGLNTTANATAHSGGGTVDNSLGCLLSYAPYANAVDCYNARVYTSGALSATGQSSTNVNTADFAQYTSAGSGDMILGLRAIAGPGSVTGVPTITGLTYGGSSSFSGSVEVIYTYEMPTPEPATMAGCGAALIGLACLSRRWIARR